MLSDFVIQRLTPADYPVVDQFKPCHADIREIEAFTGMVYTEIISRGSRQTDYLWGMVVDQKLVGLFGLSLEEGYGRPWALTDGIVKHLAQFRFLAQSKVYLNKMLDICPVLENHVWVDNHSSIKWLEWLGFTIHKEEVPLERAGLRFLRFSMVRSKPTKLFQEVLNG